MSRFKARTAAAASAALLLLLAACDGDNDEKPDPDSGPSGTYDLVSAELPGAQAPAGVPAGTNYVVTVNLQPNVKWSDGTPLTAQDFLGAFNLLWAQQSDLWNSLVDVKAVSDTTLEFDASDLSQNVLHQLLRSNQTGASSVYGDIYKRIADLRASGAKPDSADVAAALEDLDALKPDEPVTYGPFNIDPGSVTAQSLKMVKNPGGLNAEKIGFEEVDVAWGSTQESVPLILQNELDYTTDALTPSDVKAVSANSNIELIRTPLSTGAGLWFNETIKPFDDSRFRQAVAYIIDRDRDATVALGDAAKPVKLMAGFSDSYAPDWLSEDVQSKLNPYSHDLDKASELLEEVGLAKDGDEWSYDGQPLSFEITAPTDFTDLLASAKDVSEQLNEFGFDTQVRGIPAASRPDTITQGRYQAMLDFSMVSAPEHPATSLDWNMAEGFFGTNDPESSGAKGLAWPWDQTAPDGSQVYIPDLLAQATAGMDTAPQKTAVETLAQIFNDQLPVIPIFERYTTDPIAHGPRVTGWLPADHPIYQNNQGNDPYIAMQLLEGVLKPADGSDGTFKTDAPYSQPPDFSWNYFAANGMWNSLTTPAYHVTLPPLFFHARALDSYVAGVGESYAIAKVG